MREIRQDREEQQEKLDEEHRARIRELEEKSRKMAEQNLLKKIQDEQSRQKHQRQIKLLQERSERESSRQQQEIKSKLAAQTRQDQKRLDAYKNDMTRKLDQIKRKTDLEMKQLTAKQAKESKRLAVQAKAQKAALQLQVATLESEMRAMNEKNKRKQMEMLKIIEKKNYESHFQMPEKVAKHQAEHPRAFYIQVLGCRGAGKSTFVNKLLTNMGIDGERALTGAVETTMKTTFFEVTQKVISKPRRYNEVFLVDQPGIGGLQITEAGYLANYGPGLYC